MLAVILLFIVVAVLYWFRPARMGAARATRPACDVEKQPQLDLRSEPSPTTMTLLQFLRQARQVHLQFLAGTLSEPPIYVLGNPSADLDSIISAIVYSYCASNRLPTTTPRPHVPLLNLPNVPAGSELYRLRPEFATALWLSTNFPAVRPEERFEYTSESAGKLLRDHLVTVADFAQSLKESTARSSLLFDAVMVDWNAMQSRVDGKRGYGSIAGLEEVTFRTVGCIDHHVDEDFMPRPEEIPAGQPMIVLPGPGSCSSLVTSEMHKRAFWPSGKDSALAIAQVAKLILAPVLVDTSNLTSEDKVKDVDIWAVDFLRHKVDSAQHNDAKWDMVMFYEKVLEAKKNSLDLLTLEEVLDRDYKDWTETAQSSGQTVKLGFCSSVKPIRWIIQKAGGPQQFLDGVRQFAAREDKQLDVVVVMASFTSTEDEHARELFICADGDSGVAVDGIKAFVNDSSSLGLVEWMHLDGECVDLADEAIRSTLNGASGVWRHIWVQTNASASRKLVAPMLREAVAKL
ncbi:hypothetical protein N7462_003689 [Penicillium macrosclerotiorum]|uniref:uncharacterized protein n=1 Tax=Penicillium macrosclerotiorum TaxID=303699 RepID=UPI00254808C5|nr:uncharacterized protein N7462_003689 [Penicillium macrosclerotiorum]KAJ5689297.1 hypothetical protein N7462_003689 [Penicillium macrosclerotiorum]